jgi:hypothetical protein
VGSVIDCSINLGCLNREIVAVTVGVASVQPRIVPREGKMSEIWDWELMAYDISEALSKNSAEYGADLDLTHNSIAPNLPAFIAACQATQAELEAKEDMI